VSSMTRTAGVVAAAGAGARFREAEAPAGRASSCLPKTLVSLAGRPLWTYAAAALAECEEVAEIVVAAPADHLALTQAEARSLDKVVAVVAGGQRRQDSVLNALRALAPTSPDFVAAHDGARPLATSGLIRRCIRVAWEKGSGVAALPVRDTLKSAGCDGCVTATLDRSSLWAMQTPQVFRYQTLLKAHEAADARGYEATDDAALVEQLGETVWLVRGEETNLKVTTPLDLDMAASLLGRREAMVDVRVGHGFDVHRFDPARPCILGGVSVPHEAGLAGHSDADVVTHAIMDAALGALALGDIGQHFPDTDPAYAGASSLELAERVARLIAERGYHIAAVDVTVVAEAPRVAPHAGEMRRRLAEALGCEVERVSVKGTTTEGLGFTGRREGIAAHAVVVVRQVAGDGA
jgi:2-C-methyl-D-erythritol 4-phosphate cytidylyltransferase/2-C-methyl-D-erythritol 2,4-cyclodiphosphate synthase